MTVEIEVVDGNLEITMEEGLAPQGLRGNGIETIEQNDDYSLTITDTDGNTYTTDPVRGLPGNGIESAELNDDYTLTLTFTDGDSYTTPVIRGERGQGFVTNLIDGTMEPDMSFINRYPHVIGQSANTIMTAGNKTTAVHGFRLTNTSATLPSVKFGAVSQQSLNGLVNGKTYTLSFDAKYKLGSNISGSQSSLFMSRLMAGTTKTLYAVAYKVISEITAENKGTVETGRCEFTFTVPDDVLYGYLTIECGGASSYYKSGDYFEITNLKLEEGSEATPWEPSYLEMRGDKGDTGNGVVGTEKTGTSGLVDTYTMSYDNGDSDTFTVTNGQDGTDGHSPVITASKSGGATTISVDDEPIATILDGTDGTDGHSPAVTASKSQGVTTISVDSEPIATINDGTDGHSPEITTSKIGTTTTILSDGEPIGTVDDGSDYVLTSQDKTDIAAQVRDVYVETVSGSAVSITGVDNHRYMCGTVSSISITPPVSGMIDVVFTSGSTAAVLTLPNSVKMPEWFDATALETETVYEICITDGVYGTVMTWST